MDAAELRPLRVGEILDVSIKIYRSHFATLVKAVAVVVAPVQVLAALVQASARDSPFGAFPATDPEVEPDADFGDFWTAMAAFAVVGLLGLVAGQLATAASLKAVSGAYMGEEPDWRSSLRFAVSRLGPLVWLAVLEAVAFFFAALACLVPAIYLYGAWAVSVPVLLLEDRRGRRALGRSRELVRDRWWPTFAAVVLGALLAGAVQAAFGFLLGLAVGFSGTENEIVLLTSQAIIGTLSGVLVTPFSAALAAVVYFDLRVRKEGLDLELLAQRVGVTPPTGGAPAVLAPRPEDRWQGPPQQGWAPPPPSRWPSPPSWPPPPPPPPRPDRPPDA